MVCSRCFYRGTRRIGSRRCHYRVCGDTKLRARVARATLDLAGCADVPVGYGIGTPLSGKEIFWTGHEGSGYDLSAVPEPTTPASEIYAQALTEYGWDLGVAAIGLLTNVVSALQNTDTQSGFVMAMAGRFDTDKPDRNVVSDTVAATELMKLRFPVLFVGIELCRQVPYYLTDVAAIADARPGHPLTNVVADRTGVWWRHRGERYSNLCAPLTMLALSQPGLFEFSQIKISFVPDGDRAGATVWKPAERSHTWFASNVTVAEVRRTILHHILKGISEASAQYFCKL